MLWIKNTDNINHGIRKHIKPRINHKIQIADLPAAFTKEYIWITGIKANQGYASQFFLLIIYNHHPVRMNAIIEI